jgi:hypothetical protein
LKPKQGSVVENTGNGWSTTVDTLRPGIPGDSGSGFLTSSGAAFGVLSTLTIAPLAGSNAVGNLSEELAYAQSHGFGGGQLVPGTEPFHPNLATAVLAAGKGSETNGGSAGTPTAKTPMTQRPSFCHGQPG